MKCTLLMLILLAGQGHICAGGFSTWYHSTPGGNTLYYDDSYFYEGDIKKEAGGTRLFCGQVPYMDMNYPLVSNLIEWYYQPGYVIGTFMNRRSWAGESKGTVGYFLFDEGQCMVTTFRDEGAWKKELSTRNLVPVLWKKSHTHVDYSMLGYEGDFDFLVWLFITALAELVNLVIFITSRFKWWKQFIVASIIICIPLLAAYWRNTCPYGL